MPNAALLRLMSKCVLASTSSVAVKEVRNKVQVQPAFKSALDCCYSFWTALHWLCVCSCNTSSGAGVQDADPR